MLQYLTQPETKYSVVEQAQMVIEGGCSWIQLHFPDIDTTYLREISAELIPLCKETATILMLENNPEMAKELGLHGVHITLDSNLDPQKIREDFGPEAIIGVEVDSVEKLLAFRTVDIDYVSLPHSLSDAEKNKIAEKAVAEGNTLPIVFEGKYTIDDIYEPALRLASGICSGKHIIDSSDPVKYTEQFLTALNRTRK